jgi:hypothetical protein
VIGVLLIVAAFMYDPVATSQNVQLVVIIIGGRLAISGWRAVSNPKLAIKYHSNPKKTVAELIDAWTPDAARLELDYERAVHKFLKSKLPFVKITRQCGSARVKCDLAVGSEVFIELKKGLHTTNKLQRLIGQVEIYHNEWKGKPVIIVLLGDSEEDLLHDLQRSINKYETVRVVTKHVAAPADADEVPQHKVASAN